ncbi:hypothetical protein HPB52_004496 [Rhipicephalus sanguineus]|uniref:Uncharacterized protein n=1 Tax=Rhipicephalus sanguineus TaxID=34632 RepID=A0A9D4Q8R7_RHISA|nr:hypothetical protein HPB52_004496 [Rhipicephalus sanguineus]
MSVVAAIVVAPRHARSAHTDRAQVDKGGLGIPELGIMASALYIRWTHVALDSDMTLTRSFASYFLSTQLRQFSASELCQSVPRAGTRSPFYVDAATTMSKLQCVDPEYDVVSVQLQEVVDILTPKLPEHYKRFDLSRHKSSWKLITVSFLDARCATFMHRLARGCLPIMYRPFTTNNRRGVCPFCQRDDTVHIFSQCTIPAALLQRAADLFKVPGIPYPMTRFLHPLPSHAVNQFVLLLVECQPGLAGTLRGCLHEEGAGPSRSTCKKCGKRSGSFFSGSGIA